MSFYIFALPAVLVIRDGLKPLFQASYWPELQAHARAYAGYAGMQYLPFSNTYGGSLPRRCWHPFSNGQPIFKDDYLNHQVCQRGEISYFAHYIHRLHSFYSAPTVKFWFHLIMFVAEVAVAACVTLGPLHGNFARLEILLLLIMVLEVVDHIPLVITGKRAVGFQLWLKQHWHAVDMAILCFYIFGTMARIPLVLAFHGHGSDNMDRAGDLCLRQLRVRAVQRGKLPSKRENVCLIAASFSILICAAVALTRVTIH